MNSTVTGIMYSAHSSTKTRTADERAEQEQEQEQWEQQEWRAPQHGL